MTPSERLLPRVEVTQLGGYWRIGGPLGPVDMPDLRSALAAFPRIYPGTAADIRPTMRPGSAIGTPVDPRDRAAPTWTEAELREAFGK